MSTAQLEWQQYRLFPYERELARREVARAFGSPADINGEPVLVPVNGNASTKIKRLTYFRGGVLPTGEAMQTDQARLERASAQRRTQGTRYSAHGLHDYKGKFNPQVVRAIGNILGLEQGDTLFDPFCGSGTTLLEAAHNGWNAVGVDLNPLAVFIANAKVASFHADPHKLGATTDRVLASLATASEGADFTTGWSEKRLRAVGGSGWRDRLPNLEYLEKWFPIAVLAQYAAILRAIDTHVAEGLRPVFLAIASDLARDASLQDPGDLRIRRRKDPAPNYPLLPWFVDAVETRVARVIAARSVIGRPVGTQQAVVADNRAGLRGSLPRSRRSALFDAAITSPPYATALPYIDTQRLSLCLLGLLDAEAIAKADRELTGSREITTSERKRLEAVMADSNLPPAALDVCRSLLARVEETGTAGFRRRNTPALLFRYLHDMSAAFAEVLTTVREGATFALVVGRNRTNIGGVETIIDTPRLLADVAEHRGWIVDEVLELDAYQRFSMHQRNSIRTEALVMLRR